jgi:prepilin-type N-terminal cleavage/methylation domain-containing protein
MKGFSLLEMMVVAVIIAVLVAVALPYYYNAVESARMTEVVILWGKQKGMVSGYSLTPSQADKINQRLQKANLKHFTGQIFCREHTTDICWEARFTQNGEPHARYTLVTTDNFSKLACVPVNGAGKSFCESQAISEPIELDGQNYYIIR